MKSLSLGYSPCPNDTFIFYGLVHGKVPADLLFSERLEDVESLNRKALLSALDITKASFHAFGHAREKYCLLRSGGALGKGCGPLVIARENYEMKDLRGKRIAIPGKLTTAFLLLQIFDPLLNQNIEIMPFNEIIDSVASGASDAGLIIHESRFTYDRAGLKKVMDLGDWWEKNTGLLLPLGGILARRDLGKSLIGKIDGFIRKSIEYAFSNRDETLSYIKRYSQEMENDVIEKHIGLYVNDHSFDIQDEGTQAVEELFRKSEALGIIRKSGKPLFAG